MNFFEGDTNIQSIVFIEHVLCARPRARGRDSFLAILTFILMRVLVPSFTDSIIVCNNNICVII